MLGGNSEFLAKQELKKLKFTDEVINQSNAYNETDDEEVLKARKLFKELEAKYSEQIKQEKDKVTAVGGLKIVGTERHESRRIDNQLRGRSGRQGDQGESRFYIGLDDDLMKIFGGDAVTAVFNTLGADEDMPIESGIITRQVESAQKRVEGKNFSIRKHVLQYDDVMNTQREIIYGERRQVLNGDNLKPKIEKMISSVAEELVLSYTTEENSNTEGLNLEIRNIFGIDNFAGDANDLTEQAMNIYEEKEKMLGEKEIRELERIVMLKVVDDKWMTHIDNMDELKDGIGLRAYGQKDPVVQYRIEGFEMFDQMINDIKLDVVKLIMHIKQMENMERTQLTRITNEGLAGPKIITSNANEAPQANAPTPVSTPIVNSEPKVGRNDPCICRKWKKV